MSIKLDNLADWHPLAGSVVLRASDDRSRRVRIYFNCLEATPLFVVEATAGDDGRVVKRPARFLATMPAGLETLEFIANGEVEIAADDVDRVVYWQSTEREEMWFDGDGESFTTIHDRAPRNEALEWVTFQAEQNQKRMEAALRSEMMGQLAAMRSEYERQSGVHGGEAPQRQKPKSGAGKAGSADQQGDAAPGGTGAEGDGSLQGETEE
ncbi:hypothetical protein [Mesorhizobium shangrilense]|uniref:Uncharacterized protein n=1 Tax=Mesorhizobium shangrilense TaxID=460060 RepID=A0ABV2DPI5_9HYPH